MSKKKADNFSEIEGALNSLGAPKPPRALQKETLARLGLRQKPAFPPGLALAACLAALFLAAQPWKQASLVDPAQSAAAKPASKPGSSFAQVPKQAAPQDSKFTVEALKPLEKAPQQALPPILAPEEAAQAPAAPALNPKIEVPVFSSQGSAQSAAASASAAKFGGNKTAPPSYSFNVRLNRFRPALGEKVRFAVSLESAQEASLEAFDSRGAKVAEAFRGHLPAGASLLSWDGGASPSGAYTLIFKAGQKYERIRVVLVR